MDREARDALARGQAFLKQYHKEEPEEWTQYAHMLGEVNESLLNAGRFQDARALFMEFKSLAKRRQDPWGNAVAFILLGYVYFRWGEVLKALQEYKEGLQLARRLGDSSIEGIVRKSIGQVYHRWGDIHKALEQYRAAQQLFKQIGDLHGEAAVLNHLGEIYNAWGDLNRARSHHVSALNYYEKLGDKSGQAVTHLRLGQVYGVWGQLQEAERELQRAQQVYNSQNDRYGEGLVLNELGQVYFRWGQLQEALKHYQQAETVFRDANDRYGEGLVLNELGQVYFRWGQLQVAEEYFTKALKIRSEVEHRQGEAITLTSLGLLYQEQGLLEKAQDAHQRALKIRREVNDRRGEAVTIINLGAVFRSDGKLAEANKQYQQALKIFQEVGDQPGEGIALTNLGVICQQQDDPKKALNYHKDALEILEKAGDTAGKTITLNNQAEAFLTLNRYASGFRALKQAIDGVEMMVGEAQSEAIRRQFRSTQISIYNNIVHLLLLWSKKEDEGSKEQREHLENALKFLELGKARELVDKLEPGEHRVDLATLCPKMQKVIEEEQQLSKQLQVLNRVRTAETQSLAAARLHDDDSSSTLLSRTVEEKEIQNLADKLKELRRRIQAECPDPGQVRQTATYNPLPAFKRLFKDSPNAIIWQFFHAPQLKENQFQVLVWSKDGIELHQSNSFDINEALSLLRKVHSSMRRGTRSAFSEANENLMELAQLIGSAIPKDLWLTIMGKNLLVLVPHGQLHLLPWNIAQKSLLKSSADSKSKATQTLDAQSFLGLSIPIIRSFSLGLVVSCQQREEPMKTRLLLVANPNFNVEEFDDGIRGNLPAADREVEAIEQTIRHLPSPPLILGVLRHEQATQERFENLVEKEPSIIHFAGHGAYDANDPWLSHLKFYDKDGYDPYTVTEMMMHRLAKSPLFVMSACETARGEFSAGDEAIGILRGLTLSGATSILATNWLLNTSAAEHFMPAFYRYFFRGDSTAQALFKARHFLYQLDSEFEKPIHWAIYGLYGNPYKRLT